MPSYADIGKVPKDLLLGNAKSGAFVFDPKVSWASTTSSGVAFTASAIRKADRVDGNVKVSYATPAYSADTTVDPSGKATVNLSVSPDSIKGVKLSTSILLPDPSTAKLSVDYTACREFSVKATTTLTSAPVVDVVAATEYKSFLLGVDAAYDTAKSAITRYNFAAGYNTIDYQVGAFLINKGSTLKFSYAHSVNPTTTVGAEATREVSGGATTFSLGYAKKLSNGALAKLKLDSSGLLSTLYETKLASGEKVAGSVQLQGTDLSRPLKYGFAIDLS